jgi:hypothetical protein
MDGHVERWDWGKTWEQIGPYPNISGLVSANGPGVNHWRVNYDMIENVKKLPGGKVDGMDGNDQGNRFTSTQDPPHSY